MERSSGGWTKGDVALHERSNGKEQWRLEVELIGQYIIIYIITYILISFDEMSLLKCVR
jgi:hypothetical protein